MIEDNEHVKLLKENILEANTIELSITIRPVIFSVMRQHYYERKLSERENTPIWHCLFEIRSGKDKAFMFSSAAYGMHDGEREGEQWEKTKRMWQEQYDYIRQYLGFAMLSIGELLAEEAQLARGYPAHGYKADWDTLSKQAIGALGTLANQYWDSEGKAREKKDWPLVKSLDVSARTMEAAQHHLATFFMRLQGTAYVNAGKNKTSLRFSIAALERLRGCYTGYRDMWNLAASIADSKRYVNGWLEPYTDETWDNVKAEIKQVCNLPESCGRASAGIPDQLLDELRPKKSERSYEPYQLAYVHAAYECGIFMAGPAWPKANNWRVISDALQEYMRSTGEPVKTKEASE